MARYLQGHACDIDAYFHMGRNRGGLEIRGGMVFFLLFRTHWIVHLADSIGLWGEAIRETHRHRRSGRCDTLTSLRDGCTERVTTQPLFRPALTRSALQGRIPHRVFRSHA